MSAPDASSPHAAYDRYVARQERRVGWWVRAGHIAAYVTFGLLSIAAAALLIATIIDLHQPRVWGTFTMQSCEQTARHGCRPLGVWRSDDGAIVKHDIYLDGGVGPDGTSRASYQPEGIINDDSNNVVHVPAFSAAGPLVAGGLLFGTVGYILYKAWTWGHIPIRRRVQGRSPNGRRAARRS
ncbi:MAG: hypothetical protein J0I44_00975 [Microbacterium sp.]|nr:hypothetical protein [Microbacterium sp.]